MLLPSVAMLLFAKQLYTPSACKGIPKPFAVVSTTSFLDSLLEKSLLFTSSAFSLSPNTISAAVYGDRFIKVVNKPSKVQLHKVDCYYLDLVRDLQVAIVLHH